MLVFDDILFGKNIVNAHYYMSFGILCYIKLVSYIPLDILLCENGIN